MRAHIDTWTLQTWRDPHLLPVLPLDDRSIGQQPDREQDHHADTVAEDLSRNRISLERASQQYARLIPTMYWPTIFIAASDKDWAASLVQRPLTYAPQVAGLLVDRERSIPQLGIVALRCPPSPSFLNALADHGRVAAITAASAPIVLPRPQLASAERANVPALIGLRRDDQDKYGDDVYVVVVDSGLDLTHGDFGRVAIADCANFSSEPDLLDHNGHGTHVAGIVAGDGSRSQGEIRGIAPRCRLGIAKVFDAAGQTNTERILRALAWAIEHGADVINLSLGSEGNATGRSVLTLACERAAQLQKIVVVSAGNSGPDEATITAPADGLSVIAVGAVDDRLQLASFSSRGSRDEASPVYAKPTCVAPGVAIRAPRSQHARYFGWGAYVDLTGTSMAAPVVAGAFAICWSAARRFGSGDAAVVVNVFKETCSSMPRCDGRLYESHEVGHGIVQVSAAVERLVLRPTDPRTPVHTTAGISPRTALCLDETVARAAEQRLTTVDVVVDPRTGRTVSGVRTVPFDVHRYHGHGSDTQRVLQLRLTCNSHADEWIWPINQTIVRGVRRGALGVWRDTNVLLAVTSWSPLDELVPIGGCGRRPATAADIRLLLSRLRLPEEKQVWLAVASTTGWVTELPDVIDDVAYCVYFRATSAGGWTLARVPPTSHAWFARAAHPETDAALVTRARQWFDSEGRQRGRVAGVLDVSAAAAAAEVPADVIERLFWEIATGRQDWHCHPRDPSRLLYMPS